MSLYSAILLRTILIGWWQYALEKYQRGWGLYFLPIGGLTPEYLTLYGLKLKEGRFFDLEKDKDREEKVVLNETALKMFGFTSLEEAELESQYWGKGWKVIGVVEDFRVDHLAVPKLR